MATYYINAQRTADGAISKVRYTDLKSTTIGSEATKASVISWINGGNEFRTITNGGGGVKVGPIVNVVDGAYLRTDANNVKKDNLGELPEF